MSSELETRNEENTELTENESTERRSYQAPVDILESDDNYVVVSDMPGVDPAGISIRLDQEMLIIEADSDVEGLEPIQYRRIFRVVRGLDPEGVNADYKQGVLTVSLPKPPSHKPRQITVTAG